MVLNPAIIPIQRKSNFHPLGEKSNLVNPEIKGIHKKFNSSTCGLRGNLKPQAIKK
jgi:hypothetical protein